MSSPSELLAEVDAAIRVTLTAQSYSAPGGRQKQMADLASLRAFRRELLDEISQGSESSGSMSSLCQLGDAT